MRRLFFLLSQKQSLKSHLSRSYYKYNVQAKNLIPNKSYM